MTVVGGLCGHPNTLFYNGSMTGVYMAARIMGLDSMNCEKSNPESELVWELMATIIDWISFSTSSFASASSSVLCDNLS